MWRPRTSGPALGVLVFLLSVPLSLGDLLGEDALCLVQTSVQRSAHSGYGQGVEEHNGSKPWMWGADSVDSNTLGNVAPRIMDDTSMEEARREAASERSELASSSAGAEWRVSQQAAMSESQAYLLASALGSSLGKIGTRLDTQLDLAIEFKESLLQTSSEVGQRRLEALENATVASLDAISSGWSNIGVVLRSAVQSAQSKLEVAGQISLSANLGRSLGDALSRYDAASETVFDEIRGSVSGLGKESPAGVAKRMRELRASLRAYRWSANSFAHTLHREFETLAEAIDARAAESKLPPVIMKRVNTSFGEVSQSAAGIAWKTYSGAWMLTTGILVVTSDLSEGGDFRAEITPETFKEEVVAAESTPIQDSGDGPAGPPTPMKPKEAQSVSMALQEVALQVDGLMNRTKGQTGALLETLKSSHSERKSAEAQIRKVIDAVLPGWSDLGDLLRVHSDDIARCLEVAGQDELARKLSSMVPGAALHPEDSFANYSGAGAAHAVNATMEAFLQQEDVLAHLFYRAFSEFIKGLMKSPGGGRVTKQREVSLLLSSERWHWERQHDEQGRFCASVFVPSAAQTLALAQLGGGSGTERLDASSALRGGAVSVEYLQAQDGARMATMQEAAAIAWKIHSTAWVLANDLRKAAELVG